jgi:hypothetical protein
MNAAHWGSRVEHGAFFVVYRPQPKGAAHNEAINLVQYSLNAGKGYCTFVQGAGGADMLLMQPIRAPTGHRRVAMKQGRGTQPS